MSDCVGIDIIVYQVFINTKKGNFLVLKFVDGFLLLEWCFMSQSRINLYQGGWFRNDGGSWSFMRKPLIFDKQTNKFSYMDLQT